MFCFWKSEKKLNKKDAFRQGWMVKNKVRESCMIQVKLFDQEHEKDLEWQMNRFLQRLDEKELVI